MFKEGHMKTVLHVTEALGGGIYQYVLSLCNELIDLNYNVVLVYSTRSDTPKDLEKYFNPKVKLLPLQMSTAIAPLDDFMSILKLIKVFRTFSPDVIHLHSSKAGALGRVAGWVLGINGKVFYTPHGLAFIRTDVTSLKRNIYTLFEWLGARLGGHLLACSKGELIEIKSKINPKKVSLLENTVNVAEIPIKAWHRDSQLLIGIVGRITPAKNPYLFLRLAEILANSSVKFVWIGGGEDNDIIRSFKDSNIEVTGWRPREEALARMAGLDIYIQTSLWEGRPLSVIESQVAGIPAVVANIAGHSEIVIHGKTGFVASNEEDFVKFLRLLIENEELRLELGRNARKRALNHFSMDHFMKSVAFFYNSTTVATPLLSN